MTDQQTDRPTYAIWNEDCITGMPARLEPESVHHCVSSIPFGALFAYSGKTEDVGNNADGVDMRASAFGLNMRFFVEQLYRVLAPGSVACIHIQQLIATKVQHGYMGRRDFRGSVVDLFTAGGFDWTGEFVIPKNPQVIAQRQKLHSLMFVTGKRDSRQLAPAVNDYVMVFRKPGDGVPVRALYDPHSNPDGWLTTEEWIRDASGVWRDIRETDVLTGWQYARETDQEKHVCLARGSLVLTQDGYIPIEEVEVGSHVLTHRGRWRPVIAKVRNGVRSVIRTTAQGVADLRTTPDHPLYVRSGTGTGRWPGRPGGTSHPRLNAMRNDPEWMRADQTLGSYLNLPLPPIEESPYSAHDWWVIGRWLGDGHVDSRGRLHISCGKGEIALLTDLLDDRCGAVTDRGTSYQIALNDRDGRLRELVALCGRGADGKRVPAEALALDPEKAEALLSGYLSADGHFVERYQRWTASSVSRPLLLGMAMVAQRARGVVASVYAGREAGTTTIEGRTVQTKQDWILSIPPRNLSALMLEDGAWKKVRSIEDAGEVEVWDLQVQEDESFVAEGCVVHNCPLQLEVIRRCIRLYSNPGDTVIDPFMGIGSTAFVAIEQGRNAVGFELKESYHQQALDNCKLALRKLDEARNLPLFAGLTVG